MSEELIGAAALTGRYVIGCVLLMAALPKLFARRQFAQAVANYQLLPDRLVHPVAAWLPRVEVICGGCLLLGIAIKPVAAVTGVMLGAFAVAVTVNLIQGREIECGCSGTVAPEESGGVSSSATLLLRSSRRGSRSPILASYALAARDRRATLGSPRAMV